MTNMISIIVGILISIESSGGVDVRQGDGGQAAGALQMWRCAVDEANRIERIYARRFDRPARRWSYGDRHCTAASIQMCELTLMWHYRRGTTDPVELACRWRNPYSRTSPSYRRKVKERMEAFKLKKGADL